MRALGLALLVGCGGARPVATTQKPEPAAPTRQDCERAVSASFAEKGGNWAELAADDRERMISDCVADGEIAQP